MLASIHGPECVLLACLLVVIVLAVSLHIPAKR
jgi:hypothetical protein